VLDVDGDGLERFHTIYIRSWHGWAYSWSGLQIRLYIRSQTFSYGRLYNHTRTLHPYQVFKSFKNHTRLTWIHSNGPIVTWFNSRLVWLYVWFTRVANRISCVFCVRWALSADTVRYFLQTNNRHY
jgi:hypothetical protein